MYSMKAIEIDNRCSSAYSNIGIINQREGKLKQAFKYLSKAIYLNTQEQHYQVLMLNLLKIIDPKNMKNTRK